jgi:hypothetical protein
MGVKRFAKYYLIASGRVLTSYGKLPITVPLLHKPHPPATCQETASEYCEGGTTKVMPPAPAKRLSRGLSSMRINSHVLF